jgi:hypothetical protein
MMTTPNGISSNVIGIAHGPWQRRRRRMGNLEKWSELEEELQANGKDIIYARLTLFHAMLISCDPEQFDNLLRITREVVEAWEEGRGKE